MSTSLFPLSPRDDLLRIFQNRLLSDISGPSAVIDIAKVRSNAQAMLATVKELQVSFRAHVKTHKSLEITRIQVGESCEDVRLIVSTVIEAEQLLPLLLEYQSRGAKVNVLYGVPLGPSQVAGLAEIGKQLGPGSISAMVDNVAQLEAVKQYQSITGHPIGVFLKTDSGYHRAGLGPDSREMISLVSEVSKAETQGHLSLLGFYSHNSLSYGGSSPDDAMEMLKVEIEVCRQASAHLNSDRAKPLVISVGASPTVLSLQNIVPSTTLRSSAAKDLIAELQLAKSGFELEVHAGVYPLFDVQQVAACSREFSTDPYNTIAGTILTEVCSLYPNRTEQPEALVSAGCLALAREPCKEYPGWGILTPWNMPAGYSSDKSARVIISRISQEHGILGFEDTTSAKRKLPLEYGQKVRIWPNHACITLAQFGWYLIVDSETDSPDTVRDVYVRWRGW